MTDPAYTDETDLWLPPPALHVKGKADPAWSAGIDAVFDKLIEFVLEHPEVVPPPLTGPPPWHARAPLDEPVRRTVVRYVSESLNPHPPPEVSELVALGLVWEFVVSYEHPAVNGEWESALISDSRARYGEPWRVKELKHRGIIWHMTQDLPPEAGWKERWDALEVPENRQVYMRAHFGHLLG